ncbi:hypothetical protein COU80_05115 [Candidatus Peregrinibacteria bacterium CG10_big_fil_rev_8_21_14_0_10_55_24]|nr:MAG: hypothetical protein COU80_05115 [Candidatus Peregrinibacteria bacterium CG10_big_fil_rev_8_21_14_0_10_55_24]
MANRIAFKIVGAQGQGVNSVGEMVAKGLKRAGYCVFGNREYASLIKGGHSSYQLDVSDSLVRSSSALVDVVVSFNHHGILFNLHDLKPGGVLLHQTLQWTFERPEDQEYLRDREISVLYLPTEEILAKLHAKPILGNVLITAVVWAILGRAKEELFALVQERFGHKKDLLAQNLACIDAGWAFAQEQAEALRLSLPKPDDRWKNQLLLTGSQAMGLGMVHAGCRFFAGYPMTPASPLLSFLADIQKQSGMVIKQAEDEITAVQMTVGAMHAGTRAATATSGGGYDLMTETVSMCGISETPLVIVLAQRPGPGTGLPTWTAQGDLLLAVGSGHGEFPRVVLSVSDAVDAFSLMPEAFNLAEEWQLPVIVLTDKHTAEAISVVEHFPMDRTQLRRGALVTDARKLASLTSADRYATDEENGVSPRWLPGTKAATYCAQSYEHAPDGSFEESAQNAKAQMEKRMRKMKVLQQSLPGPELWVARDGEIGLEGAESAGSQIDLLVVGWGSTKGAALDALEELTATHVSSVIGYLHYTYLWPLKTERVRALAARAKRRVLVEGNQQGQLHMLLAMHGITTINDRILAYDGRAFSSTDLVVRLTSLLS